MPARPPPARRRPPRGAGACRARRSRRAAAAARRLDVLDDERAFGARTSRSRSSSLVPDALEEDVERGGEQDDRVEARIEASLVRDRAGDEEEPLAVAVEQRGDPILAPAALDAGASRDRLLLAPAALVGLDDRMAAPGELRQHRRLARPGHPCDEDDRHVATVARWPLTGCRRVVQDRDRRVGALPHEPELDPREVVRLVALEPVVVGVGEMGQVVVAGRETRDVGVLERRRLVLAVGGSLTGSEGRVTTGSRRADSNRGPLHYE